MNRARIWAAALSFPLLTIGAAVAQPAGSTAPTLPPNASAPPLAPTTVPEVNTPRGGTMAAPTASGGSMAANSTMGKADIAAADKRFILKAASGGMAEVQAGQLAQQKSTDDKVKSFAQQMVTEHTANNQKLTMIAQHKGVTVPTDLDAKDQAEITKLQGMDGTKFDRAYMKGQVKDHTSTLKLMQAEAKSSHDADLKAFADETAPVVQKHLDMAKAGGTM